ncbi:MAG: polysaccharide deacetylase family protein [Firmicutes bacterium]|nr:polysaccharide deacetylase family protein [Bacillota bacterium]
MGKKFFAWSFDDGLEQDKKIIEILKDYGLGATFHLNSGLFGDKTYEGRIGNLGMTEKPAASFRSSGFHLLSYAPHFRIPEDEVAQVYEGYEVASHTCRHVNLARCKEEERQKEIADDVKTLSEKFGYPVVGFAYPYGAGAKESREVLKAAGMKYARLARTREGFKFPEDPLAMPLSCWHISPKTFDLLNAFFQTESDEDLFFLMFAHGYEFDFATDESNWSKFQRICEMVARHDDVISCSIRDAFLYHEGKKELQ